MSLNMAVTKEEKEKSVAEVWEDHSLHQVTEAKAPGANQTNMVGTALHMVEEEFCRGFYGAAR